jgi:signal transduction histidine kinase
MTVDDLVPAEFRPHHPQHRASYMQNPRAGQIGVGRDLMAVHKYGRKVPVEIGLSPIFTDSGLRVLATIVDISERKHAEETIRQHAKRLELVNKELEQFAYVASHDLKSPLRAIDNLATWIAEDTGDKLSENSKRDFDLLRQRVNRMTNLLNGLLEYSRIGRIKYEYEKVDCNAVVQNTQELLSVPQDFRITIEGTLPTIQAPLVAVELIFRNLIGNAIKHHDQSSGCIKISASTNNRFHEFRFEDDGPGIAPQYHQQIFRIFQTLKPRDEIEGSGMGLSLIQKALENYNGDIRVESDPAAGKRGTTFIVSWPVNLEKEKLNDGRQAG